MNTAERVVLPLTGALIAPLLSVGVVRWARRRLEEKQSTESRAFLFYSALSGVLLGQYVCHTAILPERFDSRIMNLCALAGFALVHWLECEGRMWNAAPDYMPPPDGHLSVDTDSGLDRGRMEQNSLVVAAHVDSEQLSDTIFGAQDVAKDETKRVWMLVLLYVALAVVLAMDGLLLVYRQVAPVAATACWVVNGASLSLAVYSAMLHAKYHTYEDFYPSGVWRWAVLTVVWCAMLTAAALPAVVQLSHDKAAGAVENYGMLCVYGLASGALLKLCFYYFNRGVERSHRRTIRLGVLAFAAAASQSAVTGIWM